jgi:hypothetical protein
VHVLVDGRCMQSSLLASACSVAFLQVHVERPSCRCMQSSLLAGACRAAVLQVHVERPSCRCMRRGCSGMPHQERCCIAGAAGGLGQHVPQRPQLVRLAVLRPAQGAGRRGFPGAGARSMVNLQ